MDDGTLPIYNMSGELLPLLHGTLSGGRQDDYDIESQVFNQTAFSSPLEANFNPGQWNNSDQIVNFWEPSTSDMRRAQQPVLTGNKFTDQILDLSVNVDGNKEEQEETNQQFEKLSLFVERKLRSISPSELAIELAKNNDCLHMKELLEHMKRRDLVPDKNDEKGRTVIRISIENQNAEMCQMLLKNKVKIGDSLFHAVQQNYVTGAKLILQHDPSVTKMPSRHYYFPSFTPIVLASYCGHYEMVNLLYDKGHRIEDPNTKGTTWEEANERRIFCKATSTPVYMTVYTEKVLKGDDDADDPMTHCMKLIKTIRKNAEKEPEHSEYYDQIEDDIETYMWNILDQVRSSEELFKFFGCELDKNKKELINPHASLQILDDAIGMRLVKFATHYNSQQCITTVNYQGAEKMRQTNVAKWLLAQFLIGLLFPILSLAYLIVPDRWIGKLITRPAFAFACHMMSDLVFVILVFVNVASRCVENDYLGALPTPIEWMIVLWVVGKWIQEFHECINRGLSEYLSDWWNINDIAQLTLMTLSIVLRTIEYAIHMNDSRKIPRYEWSAAELKLISEALLSWAYVFVCLRILSLIRTVRSLGPLQVSLARMATNIIEFLFIFAVVVACFALGLSELYWYYGTSQAKALLCQLANNTTGMSNTTTSEVCEKGVVFSDMGSSLWTLYWAIFGHLDLSVMPQSGRHYITENVAWSLVVFYHVVVILVLVNMLIAMMSKTYEDTSENAEVEWKLHRAAVWIRFVRREAVLPPPMNIVPDFRAFCKGELPMWFRVLEEKLFGKRRGSFRYKASRSARLRSKSAILDLVKRYKYRRLVRRRPPRTK